MLDNWKQRKHKSRTHAQQSKKNRGRGLGIALSNSKPQLRDNDAGCNAMFALLARTSTPNCTKSKVDRRGNPK